MRRGIGLLLLLALPRAARGYGEGSAAGVPDAEERLLHVLTNQVRQAPHDWPGWDTSLATGTARRPLLLEDGLLDAARFHADDMAKSGVFAHESSDGTSFGARVARYFSGPAGENIFYGTRATAAEAVTGWMNSAGHRTNILRESWTHLGTGRAGAGGLVYFVQDFGEARAPIPPLVGAAAVPAAGALRVVATYFDAGGASPRSVTAEVDGQRHPLERIAGAPGNETRGADLPWPAACVRVSVVAELPSGSSTWFPSTGALLAGPGCTSAFSADPGSTPRPPTIIDANEAGGCSATRVTHGGAGVSLLLLSSLLLARRPRSG